jgi:acetoacetyl-CoA synthetase
MAASTNAATSTPAPKCRVRPAVPEDVDTICMFLAQNMGRGISAADYRSIFEYPWGGNKPGLGFVLVDGERIVGFLGGFYAEREINGQTEKFCNPTNWCVLKEYRHASLSLLMRLLNCGDTTITELTPIPSVEKLYRQMKFQTLDTYKLFSLPLLHGWTLFRSPRPEVITGDALERALSPSEHRIVNDHRGTKCGYLLLREGARSSFIVWSRRVRKGVAFSEILHASDRELLRRHFEVVKLKIMAKDRTLLVAIDERLIGERLPAMLPYRRVSLFRSSRLTREQIDNLYCELTVL